MFIKLDYKATLLGSFVGIPVAIDKLLFRHRLVSLKILIQGPFRK